MTTKTAKKTSVMKKVAKKEDVQTLPKPTDATEEHRISLPNLEIAINHTLKVVFIVDQTGDRSTTILEDLDSHLFLQGYHLHCVRVEAPTPKDNIGE